MTNKQALFQRTAISFKAGVAQGFTKVVSSNTFPITQKLANYFHDKINTINTKVQFFFTTARGQMFGARFKKFEK